MNDIQKIIEAGCQAPSGSNSQPWRFEVTNNEITIIAEPEKDHPVLNFRNRGTLFAHGALIENIKIAAEHLGYQTNTTLFPDKANLNITATISLTKASARPTPLYEAIFKRTTNRKPYQPSPLSETQKEEFANIAKQFNPCKLILAEDKQNIKDLAQAASVNEIITLENQKLHNLFTSEIVWSEAEEKQKKSGLYLMTMELAAPKRAALKLFRSWKLMSLFNRIGVARGIASSNAKTYAKTPTIGAITLPDDDKAFLTAGGLMQRIWLVATTHGLSCHLMTGTLFFYQGVTAGALTDILSEKHQQLIRQAYQKTAKALGNPNELIAITFRIGKDGEPTARSSKQSPRVKYNTK